MPNHQKTLLIMRHAKSDWNTGEADHGRPLNQRGRNQAPIMGANIRALNFVPELILSSDSKRTQQTLDFVLPNLSDNLPDEINTKYLAELYAPDVGSFQEAATQAPDNISKLMMLSHNPGCDMIVQFLSGQRVMMKTANAALLTCELEGSWEEALSSKNAWKLEQMITPKD